MIKKVKPALFLLIILLSLAAVTLIVAQTSPGFDLTWNVQGNGGGQSRSVSYQVDGTIGQNLSGPPTSASASYQLNSGFWTFDSGAAIFLPVIVKPS